MLIAFYQRIGHMTVRLILAVAIFIALAGGRALAQDPILGEIDLVPYNFAMRGFADCSGQILSIATNTALFSILGTTYGGNGTTTFALPNLNDRIPIGIGQGPGLSNYNLGQSGGSATVTLTTSQLPAHSHSISASTDVGTSASPSGKYFAVSAAGVPLYSPASSVLFAPGMVAASGGGQPHNNWQPYLGLKWVIAVQGIFPSRN